MVLVIFWVKTVPLSKSIRRYRLKRHKEKKEEIDRVTTEFHSLSSASKSSQSAMADRLSPTSSDHP